MSRQGDRSKGFEKDDLSRLNVVGVAVGVVAPAGPARRRPENAREFPPVIRVFSDANMQGFDTVGGMEGGSS